MNEEKKNNQAKEDEPRVEKFAEALHQYESKLNNIREGQIVKGKIVDITGKEIIVDVGYKSEGVIPLSEFGSRHSLKIGDEIDVLLESKEDENGMVVLSKSQADQVRNWESITQKYKEGGIIEGKVFKKVKGGLMVDIGMEAFLPASLLSIRPSSNPDQFIGQTLKLKIVNMNRNRRNVVVSHRDYLLQERQQSKEGLLKEIEKGQSRKGMVKNITDFGAFIDLGGMDGLLHITDMSWSRISHPSEMLSIGDEIEVMILDFSKETGKISLGLKQKTPSPWVDVNKKYSVGSRIKGRVVNITSYGAFIELEKGLEGLVHISELSWTRRINHPSEVLAIGDVVECAILNIDEVSQKISLGIKQIELNPWLEVKDKYEVGTKVTCRISSITNYGAFVELETGISGLIHISDMSWTKRINRPSDILKKGQKVEAVILSIDPDSKRIALGLKQLHPDPWPAIFKKYKVGLKTTGKVTRLTNFGLFVELEKDVEALAHISQILPEVTASQLGEKFKIDDKIDVEIIKVDESEKRIALKASKEK